MEGLWPGRDWGPQRGTSPKPLSLGEPWSLGGAPEPSLLPLHPRRRQTRRLRPRGRPGPRRRQVQGLAPRQGCHRHSDMHTQAARTHAERASTHTSLQAPLPGWPCGRPRPLPAHSGAGGNEQVGPRGTVTLAQGRGGVAASAHAIRLLPSRQAHPSPGPLIRRKLWAWLRGRQGHPGPGRGGSRGHGQAPALLKHY